MKRAREAHLWVLPDPRLKELQVNVGSFRPNSGRITWEQTQQQIFRATACDGGHREGSAYVVSLGVEALMNGDNLALQYGDPVSAARRATHGPSNDPEPDYVTFAIRVAEASPFPGD